MCGGTLKINDKQTVATCDYCGTPQTVPKLYDDKITNMLERADQFRRGKDFDRAAEIYEEIIREKNDDAEIYWLMVLCRYGIEYVEDPKSHERIPTVNRAQFTSIYDDADYQSAIRYADMLQKILYEKEAATINEIQKGILAISNQEEPYDVFICYKETDENGERTHDSVYANELYYELTELGYKVFFSRITLEDKLGTAYEPYIFAALNSAKVMVVIGTKPEYFNAVWVKNEWSRYLAIMKKDRKRTLIPAYRNMDPYNLPREFSHLQALDMNKLGFMSDLTRGIKKIIGDKNQQSARAANPNQNQTQNQKSDNKNKVKDWYIGLVKVTERDIEIIESFMLNNKKMDAVKHVHEITHYTLIDVNLWLDNYKKYDLNHPHQITNQFIPNYGEIQTNLKKGVNDFVEMAKMGIDDISKKDNAKKESIAKSSELESLKKQRARKLIWGIVFVFLFPPLSWILSIYFFTRVHKLSKEIQQIEGNAHLEELKRDRNNSIFWGIVFVLILPPLSWIGSIYFFVKAYKLNQEINNSNK